MLVKIVIAIVVLILIFNFAIPMIFNGFNALKMIVWWMFP